MLGRLHPSFKQAARVFVEFRVESIRQMDTSTICFRQSPGFRLAVGAGELTQYNVEADSKTSLEEPGAVSQPLRQSEERHLAEVVRGDP